MFSDQYLDKDGNEKFVDVMFQWMAGQIQLNAIDAETPDVADYQFLPNTMQLSEELKSCLQEGEEVCGIKHCVGCSSSFM
jgi:intraflagellar transport protein 52